MDQFQQQHHVEDVGRILLQTQEQLRLMREQMALANSTSSSSMCFNSTSPADVSALQEILQRAELELRAKAELVLSGLVNTSSQASSLPAVNITGTGSSPSKTRSRTNVASLLAARRNSRLESDEPDIDYFRAVRSRLCLVTCTFKPSSLLALC